MIKKGELSLQVIVIAIIVLVVLVLLVYLSATRLGIFGEQTRSCNLAGGTCSSDCGNSIIISPPSDGWSEENCDTCCAVVPGITDRDSG